MSPGGGALRWTPHVLDIRSYEELDTREINAALMKLKTKAVQTTKDKLQSLEHQVQEKIQIVQASQSQLQVSKLALENAIAGKQITQEDANVWIDHFSSSFSPEPESYQWVIDSYPEEQRPILHIIAQIALTPKRIEHEEDIINLYSQLVEPTKKLIKVYEKEVDHCKAYEQEAVEKAELNEQNKSEQFKKTRDRFILERKAGLATSGYAPDTSAPAVTKVSPAEGPAGGVEELLRKFAE